MKWRNKIVWKIDWAIEKPNIGLIGPVSYYIKLFSVAQERLLTRSKTSAFQSQKSFSLSLCLSHNNQSARGVEEWTGTHFRISQ